MLVIKLGGSLATAPQLPAWLNVLAEHGRGRLIIVPGGGLFADAVRSAQSQWQFSEQTAHVMAIYAMLQYGLMLDGMHPKLKSVDNIDAIQATWQTEQVPVWLPIPMVLQDHAIEASWRMTSDSFAVWLALQLHIQQVVLVKSVTLAAATTVTDLVANDIVDPLLEHYARLSHCEIRLLGPDDYGALEQALRSNTCPGTVVTY